jgi:hypothetical protein
MPVILFVIAMQSSTSIWKPTEGKGFLKLSVLYILLRFTHRLVEVEDPENLPEDFIQGLR